ncbi:MAG TPA: FIST N-terminal domain-containing protein [Candidatus Limnocylindria bacterium]|nr:FIST N-terminal domain-containing protein [Candidatus Limnocylindria bacterium]
MVTCGDGLAIGADPERAVEFAVTEALLPLGGAAPDLACVFVSGLEPDAAGRALADAAEVIGANTVIGCSADGVVGAGQAVEGQPAVSVWLAAAPDLRLRSFHLEVIRTDTAMTVVGMPEVGDATAGMLVVDPWTFPVDGFVSRSNETLPGLPLVGGAATGLSGPEGTRLLVDGTVFRRGAVGLLITGPASVQALVSQGCRPVGPTMTVTAAEGNLLLGLAGRPALLKLREVIAGLDHEDQVRAAAGLQLGIAMDEYADERGPGDYLIRGLVGVDDSRSAVAVGDVVEVGHSVRFHVRDAESASADLLGSLARFRAQADLDAAGALLFSCTNRGEGMFGSADHDVLTVRAGLGTRRVGGFFANGEIGPVAGRNHVHAFTASMLVLGSPPEAPA